MKMNWKTACSMMVAVAFAGCAGDEAPAPGAPGGPSPEAVAKVKGPAPKAAPAAPGAKKPDDAPKVEGPAGKTSSTAAKLTGDELAAIKELPAAEQTVAEQQAVCPVSAHNLGSMGKPTKVTAEGRTFYLCCEGCEKELKANPKVVVAKLDKLADSK
jgi:YHS domain-containing protein